MLTVFTKTTDGKRAFLYTVKFHKKKNKLKIQQKLTLKNVTKKELKTFFL